MNFFPMMWIIKGPAAAALVLCSATEAVVVFLFFFGSFLRTENL